MVHPVQPPQGWYGMKEDVLQVDRQIEQDDPEHDRRPLRQIESREQTPAARLGKQGDADRGDWEEETVKKRVEGDDADVARPPPAAADLLVPARCKYLPRGHQRKHAGKGR